MDSKKTPSEPVRLEVEVLNDLIDDDSSPDPETPCPTEDTDGDTDDTAGNLRE